MTAIKPTSVVRVKDLSLPYMILAANVWGKFEPQPATLSISITLHNQFSDTEGEDNLAKSVDYSALSKYIRGLFQDTPAPRPYRLLSAVTKHVLAMNSGDNDMVKDVSVSVDLPKASMTGEALKFIWVSTSQDGNIARLRKAFTFSKMNLMALIGLRDFERQAKQPLVATMTVDYEGIDAVSAGNAFVEEAARVLEQTFVKTVEESAFETLEALAHLAARTVSEEFTRRGFGKATVNLVLEKPKAVPSAGAAVVEHTIPAQQ